MVLQNAIRQARFVAFVMVFVSTILAYFMRHMVPKAGQFGEPQKFTARLSLLVTLECEVTILR
jgi:hypothetical protein